MTREQGYEAIRDLNSIAREYIYDATTRIDQQTALFAGSHPPVTANVLEALARLYRLISKETTSE